MPLKRSQFIDKVPWWLAALVAVAYSETSLGPMRRGAMMQTVYRCTLAVVAFIVFAAGKHTEGVFAGKHCPPIRRPPKVFLYKMYAYTFHG